MITSDASRRTAAAPTRPASAPPRPDRHRHGRRVSRRRAARAARSRREGSISSPGRGIGALGAIFAAVDGGQRLWDRDGPLEGSRHRAAPTAGACRCASRAGRWSRRRRCWRCRSLCSAIGVLAGADRGAAVAGQPDSARRTAVTAAYGARSTRCLRPPRCRPSCRG